MRRPFLYESCGLLLLTWAAFCFQGAAASITPADETPTNYVLLNAAKLDTRLSSIRATRNSEANFAGRRLHLVQFSGPLKRAWREQLTNSGMRIVCYIPQNAFLIYGDQTNLAQFRSIAATAPHIRWHGDYLDAYKISPAATAAGTGDFAIQLVADDNANAATRQLVGRLKRGPFKRDEACLNYRNIIVTLAPGDLAAIAAQPDVISIQPYAPRHRLDERQDQIVAGNLSGSVPSGPGYLAWLAGKGFTQAQFTAAGFVVDVSDSGIDNGTTTPNHFALYTGGDTNNASRVVYNRLEGTPNTNSTLAGCDGHGTLNTHIIGGYDDQSGFPHTDDSGFHYGLGVCPFVKLGSSVIFDPNNFTFPNFANMESEAYESGARISNQSWGGPTEYDMDAQTYDALVRDAQPTNSTFPLQGNQEMTIVVSAGNGGPYPFSVGSPATAKNVIAVGGADGVQAFGGADDCLVTDAQADNANDIVDFSSRGPCLDGRHKPELVAPCTHISGGVFQAADPGPLGDADPCFLSNGTGVCGGPDTNLFFPAGQEFFTASSGTSHSTPCVSGACALLRQYFINNFTNPPSPAMTKAYLMNSARYLTGMDATDSLWSDSQGMGELDLNSAFDGSPRILRDEMVADIFTESGQIRSFTGTIPDTNKPFRVTVAWTDAPGSTAADAWNNDLDLRVTVGGVTYKGNVFNGAYSVPGGSADFQNNAESVFLPPGTSGNFAVQVSAANINSDGVPNNADPLDQDFALVIYNAEPVALPILASAGFELLTEGCQPTNDAIDPGETVTVAFSLQNVGQIDLTNAVATLGLEDGVTWSSGPQTYAALTANGPPVSHAFTFMAGGNCGDSFQAVLGVQSGVTNLGSIVYPFHLGQFHQTVPMSQTFDGVNPPALPAGWATSSSAKEKKWVTSTNAADTAPNAAYSPDPAGAGVNELDSPPVSIASDAAELNFRQSYALQNDPTQSGVAYDGAVLELQIGTNSYADVLDAGGVFLAGPYNATIANSFNPLFKRRAWSGNSGGFQTTTVRLPPSAAGQTVRFRWRCGSGYSPGGGGWYVDSVSVSDGGFYTCCSTNADLAVAQSPSPGNPAVSNELTYSIVVSNLGPSPALQVTLTDTLPRNASLIASSGGDLTNDNTIVWSLGSLPSGASTNLILVVEPKTAGRTTNLISVASETPDPNALNSVDSNILVVFAPPLITSPPSNQVAPMGSNAVFSLKASGTTPLFYQWIFDGTNLLNTDLPALQLTNAQSSQAGSYWVVVTNAAGAVTSAPVSLTVLQFPTIGNFQAGSSGFSLSFLSQTGVNYTLEYKNFLSNATWTALAPAQPGTGGFLTLFDTNQLGASRFYRLLGE